LQHEAVLSGSLKSGDFYLDVEMTHLNVRATYRPAALLTMRLSSTLLVVVDPEPQQLACAHLQGQWRP
jgi:hypothetical protein